MPRKKNLMINFPCFCACPIKLLFNGTGINVSLYVLKKTTTINKGFQDCFFTLCESLWSAGKLYQSRQWVCALCGLAASHSYAFSEFSSLTPSLLKCQQLSILALLEPRY